MLSQSAKRARGASVSSLRSLQAGINDAGAGAVRVAEAALKSDIQPGFLAGTAEAANQALPGRSHASSRVAGRQALIFGHDGATLIEETEQDAFPAQSHDANTSPAVKDEILVKNASVRVSPADEGLRMDDDGGNAKTKSTWTDKMTGTWKWLLTPSGFLLTLYGVNIVGWGGMLFLLLCGANPAMCWYTDSEGQNVYNCDSNESPRKIWIEIDSQILNALFCVTGLGLIPWRARDLCYLLSYRLTSRRRHGIEKKLVGLKKLASHYRAWIRLSINDDPEAIKKNGQATPSYVRPTRTWKIDLFVWCQIANTLFQVSLCYWMWAYTRYNRPSWATGMFVGLACGVAGIGGLVSYIEGRRVSREEAAIPTITT